MSRIAFLNESRPQDSGLIAKISYELVQSLQANQHTVKVFSTFKDVEQLNHNESYELAFPFRHWKPWELPFLIKELHSFRPDILHIVQPHIQQFKSAFHILKLIPSLKPLLNNIPIVLSIYESPSSSFTPQQFHTLLNHVDLILVPNKSVKHQISSHLDNIQSHHLEIIPPNFALPKETNESTESSWVSELSLPFFLICEAPCYHNTRMESFLEAFAQIHTELPKVKFVFYDGWGKISLRERKQWLQQLRKRDLLECVLISDDLSAEQKKLLEQQAEGIIALGLSNQGLSLSHRLYQSINNRVPIFVSSAQADLDNVHWSHMPHCLLTDNVSQDLPSHILNWRKNPNYKQVLTASIDNISNPTLDASTNQLARLYSDLLN